MSVKHLRPVWGMLAGVLLAACPGVGLLVAPTLPLWLHVLGAVLVLWGVSLVRAGSQRFLAVPLRVPAPVEVPGRHRQVRGARRAPARVRVRT
jgi:hypothetical protein